jgi:hypothetical protein
MSDPDAHMALARYNTQSELLPLYRGLHALDTGLSVRAYANDMGLKPGTVQDLIEAAKVARDCRDVPTAVLARFTGHLTEIHAAPSWLWPALIARLIAEGWNVETARGPCRPAQGRAPATDLGRPRGLAPALAAGEMSPAASSAWADPHPGLLVEMSRCVTP